MSSDDTSKTVDRRGFLLGGAALAGAATLSSCAGAANDTAVDLTLPTGSAPPSTGEAADNTEARSTSGSGLPEIQWQMATSWQVGLDLLFGGAQYFAERVSTLSQGKFVIEPLPAGELVEPTQVLQGVSDGTVPIGHTASFFYAGETPALAFGTALPFGLNMRQQSSWLYEGGGLELYQAVHGKNHGTIAFPCHNTGAQMGGWFNRRIDTVEDLDGLKMRIPGLGGQVLNRLGVELVRVPTPELSDAFVAGTLDAAEFIAPSDDLKLQLFEVASFYYYPGWWEPCGTGEVQISLSAWESLPPEYQEIIRSVAVESMLITTAKADIANAKAIAILREKNIEILPFSTEVMEACEEVAFDLYDEISEEDEDFATLYESWKPFRDEIHSWHSLAEASILEFQAR